MTTPAATYSTGWPVMLRDVVFHSPNSSVTKIVTKLGRMPPLWGPPFTVQLDNDDSQWIDVEKLSLSHRATDPSKIDMRGVFDNNSPPAEASEVAQ